MRTVEDSVKAVREGLPDSHEWDERERAILELALRQARDIDALEVDIADRGVRVDNKLNPSYQEVRLGRVALGRLLGLVDVPDSISPASLHGRRAAEARWNASQG